jgi:hypothetical protein
MLQLNSRLQAHYHAFLVVQKQEEKEEAEQQKQALHHFVNSVCYKAITKVEDSNKQKRRTFI